MNSVNFLVALIDQNFNMFKTVENSPKFIANIAEHVKRLEELSDGHHFYIDETAFKALGESQFPLRFTRVFSSNPELLKQSTSYRVHDMKMLEDTIMSKERFSANVQIFFIGGSDFLKKTSKYAKKLLLTVVNETYDDNHVISDKFPLDFMTDVFNKRHTIEPELLAQIKLYKMMKAKQKQSPTETIITDNGMKLTQPVEVPEISVVDDILNTPDYKFFEYRK